MRAPPETPIPWAVGQRDRGHGHMTYAVIDAKDHVVVTVGDSLELAEFIVAAVNAYNVKP